MFADLNRSRHAAEAASSIFDDSPQNNPDFWYEKWNGDWCAYAILENVPATLLPSLGQMKSLLESDDWVEALSDEDWDLVALVNEEQAAG